MTKRRKNQFDIPTLRLHKPSGRARVRLNGRDCYVGEYGTVAAEEAYNRLIAEWLMNGRKLPTKRREVAKVGVGGDSEGVESTLTIKGLVDAYLDWAARRYTNSNQSGVNYYATRPLVEAFGSTPVIVFGANSLRLVRQLMIQRGWYRTSINKRISTIRGIFAWGAAREMVPETLHRTLVMVEPLVRGRDGGRESSPKALVPESAVEKIKPHLSRQTYSIIRIMQLTAARCGEVVVMRPGDLQPVEVGDIRILEYVPSTHKTQHMGFTRTIRLGPKSQLIINPFLNRGSDEFLFSPMEAEAERRAREHKARITPPLCGNTVGSNRRAKPQKQPGSKYDTAAVRHAIAAAVSAYNKAHRGDPDFEPVVRFSPHQLRHSALTKIRDEFEVECAMEVAGHHAPTMTDLYSGRSNAAARRVAMEAG